MTLNRVFYYCERSGQRSVGTFHAPSEKVSYFQHQRNKKKREAVNTGATAGYHLVTSGDYKVADK